MSEVNKAKASGTQGSKIHVWNHSMTLCNKRSNNKESKIEFAQSFAKHPQDCCIACAKKLNLIK